ncbi:hypothetical protein MOQ_008297 [Trypanosoma cruzi marinkellei]|uniref:Uncharacterized protein n=1 Tax=Trypanosoma cruzi marinkellei TaxID=85056 RepID=K2MLD9_TRYCR|nr:hypothetical protein MOQ_008297 [Trypanosoma cruzi marinkellei]
MVSPNAAFAAMPWAVSPPARRRSWHRWRKRAGAPCDGAVGTVGAGEGRHTNIFFFRGHSIIRRTHSRRVALREEEDCLPQRRGDACTSSLGWIQRRINPTARNCVGELWKDTVLRPVASTSEGNELSLRTFSQRALLVKRAVILCKALEGPVAVWTGGCLLRRSWRSRQGGDGASSHGQSKGMPRRTPRPRSAVSHFIVTWRSVRRSRCFTRFGCVILQAAHLADMRARASVVV